jgi:hypothetical protein
MGVEIKGHDPKRLSPKGDKICVSLNENFFSDLLSSLRAVPKTVRGTIGSPDLRIVTSWLCGS